MSPLEDVDQKEQFNYKAIATGIGSVVLGGILSYLYPVYAWLYAVIFGVLGIVVSLKFQHATLVRTKSKSHSTDSLLKK
ncbi:MAG: hypothetical protein ABSD49_11500 [Candidatus Bathyarchaeia archaeon]|jgi:hypothetical protein